MGVGVAVACCLVIPYGSGCRPSVTSIRCRYSVGHYVPCVGVGLCRMGGSWVLDVWCLGISVGFSHEK